MFGFTSQPSIRREQIDSLREIWFMDRKEHLAFLGRHGVGKTRLAISLAVARAESGRRICSVTLSELIAALEAAHFVGRLKQQSTTLIHPTLLIMDEPAPCR